MEKPIPDAEHVASPSLAHVIVPADAVQAGDCTTDYPPPYLEDRHRLRAERRCATRQILLRLGRELAAGLRAPHNHELCDTASDIQQLPETKHCDHSSATRTSLKSSYRAQDPRLQPDRCCEGPLVIELMSELLLDALGVSNESDSSDDEGDSDDDSSCDLGTAKLQV